MQNMSQRKNMKVNRKIEGILNKSEGNLLISMIINNNKIFKIVDKLKMKMMIQL